MFSHTMKSIAERNPFRKAPVNRRAVAASQEPSYDSSDPTQNKEVECSLDVDISTKLSRLKDVIHDIGRDSETKPDEVRVPRTTSSTPKLTPRRVAKKAQMSVQNRLPDV